jgi:hypothetical protein
MWHKLRVAGDARHRGPRASRGLEGAGPRPTDGNLAAMTTPPWYSP